MKATTIESVPEEVLLMIFDVLGVKQLLESSLVCKRWNEIIESSTRVMKKVTIKVQNIQEALESRRRLVNLALTSESLQNCLILVGARKLLLRSIEFSSCKIDFEELQKVLNEAENLESLSFNKAQILKPCAAAKLTSKNLKSLTITESSVTLLDYFCDDQLTSFSLLNPTDAHVENITSFITRQTQLETISLNISWPTFYLFFLNKRFKITGASNKLRNLSVLVQRNQQTILMFKEDVSNFVQFLKLRGQNLKSVTFHNFLNPQNIFSSDGICDYKRERTNIQGNQEPIQMNF